MKYKEFNNYYVTDQGHIIHKVTGKLKYTWHNKGRCNLYERVQFRINGKQVNYFVHRLVAMLFLHDYSDNLEVNHINGNTLDNRLSNLNMMTRSENAKDYYTRTLKQGNCIFKIGTINATINKRLYQ